METGQFDTPIKFQKLTKSSDNTGGYTGTWSDDSDVLFAFKSDAQPNKQFEAVQELQYSQVTFQTWKNNYNISSAGSVRIKEVETGNIYKIITFREVKKQYVEITAQYAENQDTY